MGINHSSAGVYTSERDLSASLKNGSTTIGVVVGEASRGPVGERTLVTSEGEFISLFGKPDARIGYMGYSAIAFLSEAQRLYVTRVAPAALFGGITIGWDGHFNTSSQWTGGEASPDTYQMSASDLFAVYAINPGDWNSELFIRVYPNTKLNEGYFYLEVYVVGSSQPVEKWHCHLSQIVDGFGVQLNVEHQINRGSKYIRIAQNIQQAEVAAFPAKQFVNTFDAGGNSAYPGVQLLGGVNGRRPQTSEFIEALDLYRDPEYVEVSLLINGGITDVDYQLALDSLCKERMDCIAILDTPSDMQDVQDALSFRREILHLDSSYSALYTPDVLAADQYNDIRLYLPPSGFVAAAYARTDRDTESWFAPAGMTRGDLPVSGLRVNYDLSKRDALYESQINAIRVVEGSGIKIWGADTLQVMPSALSNVSVRRLMIVLEKTIAESLLYGVFDPNDQVLRSRITVSIDGFLNTVRNGRGLYTYGVTCDDTNNSSATIAAGDLFVDIWVDPTLPAKRIMFNAIINKTGVTVSGK